LWVIAKSDKTMKSKNKIGPLILKLTVLTLGLGLGGFCLLMLSVIIQEFVMAGLIAILVIGFISITTLHLGVNSLKTINIDIERKTLTIRHLGLFETLFTVDKIKGYNRWPFSNRFGTYKGTLIETNDGRQIHLTEFDTKNYKEIRDAVATFVQKNNDIRLKMWTTFNKSAIVFGTVMILFMIIVKIME
jgi:hypothetical protein